MINQSLWVNLADPDDLKHCIQAGDTVVVVDLFRATSTIQILIDKGCTVIPMASILDADPVNSHGFLRIGEWHGLRPGGFFADNSPTEILEKNISGRTVEFLSSNGSGAIIAASAASRVICANLFNEKAVITKIITSKGRWWLCPAGCRGDRRIEDDYVCARLGRILTDQGFILQPRLTQLITQLGYVDVSVLLDSPGALFLRRTDAMKDLDFILHSGYQSHFLPTLIEGKLYRNFDIERVVNRSV